MGKKLKYTPHSQVKSALRRLWLRSRERAAVVKRDKNTCVICDTKGSKAKGREVKTNVHHKHGIQWEELMNAIYKYLLVSPEEQEVQCEKCHKKGHQDE